MAKGSRLPSLDFLKGFDAAARHQSFTRAAEELHLTQSALSRQVKALEDEIGVALFERGRRGLALTAAGETLRRSVHAMLADIAQAVATIRAQRDGHRVTISTTVSFASLWLVPRLSRFRTTHPHTEVFVSADNRMIDLDRAEVDLVVRYAAAEPAPARAIRLFGESVVPVASPRLAVRSRQPLRGPQDLARHVLLHLQDPFARVPFLDWTVWLTSAGVPDLVPAGNLRFSQYDQLLQAAVEGQGVALGRRPLIDRFLKSGQLVMPFAGRFDVPRAYFAMAAPHAQSRADVAAFVAWLQSEAARDDEPGVAGENATAAKARRPRRS